MNLRDLWEAFASFIESGGDVLIAIFVVTALMWTLIIERLFYMHLSHPFYLRKLARLWKEHAGGDLRHAQQVSRLLVSQAGQRLDSTLPMIKTLVALCPLLGLLGTVNGMIEVFDVMAVAGNANPRAMASGVSLATIPTMAGMVAAISGLYMSVQLKRTAEKKRRRAEALFSPSEG